MQVTVSFIDIAVIVVSTGLIIWWALKKGKSGDSKSYFLAGRKYGVLDSGWSVSFCCQYFQYNTYRADWRCLFYRDSCL